MKFASMLRRLRNTQAGMRSTARSGSTPYTPYTDPPPDEPFGVTARDSQTVALGVSVQFNGTVENAPEGAILTYSWDFGEGATPAPGTGETTSCKYDTPGDKTVTLTVSYTDANGETVEACNSVFITVDPCLPLPGETEPPWITEARTYLGLHESDAEQRAELEKLLNLNPEETSWCGAFAGSILQKRGLAVPDNPLSSRSYRTWGKPCRKIHGAIVVFGPGTISGGHVGFIVETTPGNFEILGGNQSGAVIVGSLRLL